MQSTSRGSGVRRSPPPAQASSLNPSSMSVSMSSRSSSGSARSPRHRTQGNLSTIEKSVTHLLVATKQLLETLTAWSRGQATEAEVSDVYVRLGSEFNIACRAFTAIGVETSDLGNVPDALRTILESTLSQDASPQSLDEYLPRIREIIINLLQGLKRKQQKIRQRSAKENGESSGAGSTAGDRPATSHHPAPPPRTRSNEQIDDMAPPRSSSLPSGSGSSTQRASSPIPPYPTNMRTSVSTNASVRSSHQHTASLVSTQSSPPMQSAPVIDAPSTPLDEPPRRSVPPYFTPPPPPPPPPPNSQDALAALQRGGELERRASRRYSAYQIAKLTGAPTNGVSMLPSSRDPSALPRNRESRESLDAMRVRQSYRTKSVIKNDNSPMRSVSRISEEREVEPPDSPMAKTPVDKEGPAVPEKDDESFRKPPTLKVDTGASPPPTPQKETVPETPLSQGQIPSTTVSVPSPPETDERRSSTPSVSKELTLFLQLGRSVKKVVLPDGIDELSISSLRLLFISKFNYNPPSGDDFPEIYLQDPASGVRYELEDLCDVKDRAVLCLNVEVLDEVKRHIDDGMDGLRKLVEGLKGSVEGQGLQILRVAERQEEAAKKIAELSVSPPVASPIIISRPESSKGPSLPSTVASIAKIDNAAQINEIRDLRKDLAVLRQVYSTFVADINTSMATIKTKASSIKSVAVNTAVPVNEGRTHIENGKKVLSTDADNLVTRVEDLQDTVEDLRKDVVQRGVRPLPRQIDSVKKEILQARAELKKMIEYIKREKPVFRRVWERELEVVCEEQDFFNMQENLIEDLQDDLDKATQTFQLVEQCTEQQSKSGGVTGPVILRAVSRSQAFGNQDDMDPTEAKDSVLNEVRVLRPNHEGRLEAIERAEKARAKELESRVPEFQKELGEFVEENKLKKAGGVEEAERLRTARDEKARREIWERKKKMDEGAEAAEAAAGNSAEAAEGIGAEA